MQCFKSKRSKLLTSLFFLGRWFISYVITKVVFCRNLPASMISNVVLLNDWDMLNQSFTSSIAIHECTCNQKSHCPKTMEIPRFIPCSGYELFNLLLMWEKTTGLIKNHFTLFLYSQYYPHLYCNILAYQRHSLLSQNAISQN